MLPYFHFLVNSYSAFKTHLQCYDFCEVFLSLFLPKFTSLCAHLFEVALKLNASNFSMNRTQVWKSKDLRSGISFPSYETLERFFYLLDQ